MLLVYDCLLSVYRSARQVEAELSHPLIWRHRLAAGNDGGFTAKLSVEHSLGSRTIAARVGEAALLSRRLGLPIAVLASLIPALAPIGDAWTAIREFRRFLDQVSPEQFAR